MNTFPAERSSCYSQSNFFKIMSEREKKNATKAESSNLFFFFNVIFLSPVSSLLMPIGLLLPHYYTWHLITKYFFKCLSLFFWPTKFGLVFPQREIDRQTTLVLFQGFFPTVFCCSIRSCRHVHTYVVKEWVAPFWLEYSERRLRETKFNFYEVKY